MISEEDRLRLRKRWLDAAHAMQSGVAGWMQIDATETSPKHLRVGVNTSLRDMGSLVDLLVKKGVITDLEYMEAIAAGMEEEKRTYEDRLSKAFGTKVTLS